MTKERYRYCRSREDRLTVLWVVLQILVPEHSPAIGLNHLSDSSSSRQQMDHPHTLANPPFPHLWFYMRGVHMPLGFYHPGKSWLFLKMGPSVLML